MPTELDKIIFKYVANSDKLTPFMDQIAWVVWKEWGQLHSPNDVTLRILELCVQGYLVKYGIKPFEKLKLADPQDIIKARNADRT
ncbi:MAG: hypothetical protein R3213_06945 [Flavobacteriaceae bacterium]|nr:hypothetical protein [Flavobacteriaceae bacterium]